MTQMHKILKIGSGIPFFINEIRGRYVLNEKGRIIYQGHEPSRVPITDDTYFYAINHGIFKVPSCSASALTVLRALKILGFKWVATDKDGREWAYVEKPLEKRYDSWFTNSENSRIFPLEPKLRLTSWKDEEPFSIEKELQIVENFDKEMEKIEATMRGFRYGDE